MCQGASSSEFTKPEKNFNRSNVEVLHSRLSVEVISMEKI